MKTVTFLAFLLLSLVLAGCHGDDCLSPAELHDRGTRRINAVDTAFVFQDEQHPALDRFDKPYEGYFEVYHADPLEQPNASETPRAIDLTFITSYTTEALEKWKREGLHNGALYAGHAAMYILHEITLKPESLAVGTYPFSLDDTTTPARAKVYYQIRGGVTGGVVEDRGALAMTALTGSITITEAFTKTSGKLSYTVEATYLPDQKSTFHGTVSFDGFRTKNECEYPTSP
jgi:hypothetical protein